MNLLTVAGLIVIDSLIWLRVIWLLLRSAL